MSMNRDRTPPDDVTIRYQPAPTDVIAEDTGVASASQRVVYSDATQGTDDSHQDDQADDNSADVDEIRSEIEQTRSEMSHTIDAIQERLNPHRLVQEAQDTVRDATIGRAERMMNDATDMAEEWMGNASDTARDVGTGFVDTIRANPVAAALAGIGLGWLFMTARGRDHDSERRYRAYRQATSYPPYGSRAMGRTYGRYARGYDRRGYDRGYRAGGYADTDADRDRGLTDRVDDTASDVQNRAGEMMSNAGERVSDMAHGVADNVSDWTDAAQERLSDMGIVDAVRRNPLPAAVVGLGLAWMFKNMREADHGYDRDYGYSPNYTRGSYGYGRGYGRTNEYGRGYGYADMNGTYERGEGRGLTDRASEAVSSATDRVGDATQGVADTVGNLTDRMSDTAGQVQDRAGQLVDQVTDSFGDWTDMAQDRFADVRSQYDRFLDESPLAAGAVALALGVAVGMLLPGTRQENRMLGPARDRFMDQAQDMVEDTTHKVQRVVDEVQHTVKQEAQNQGLTGQPEQFSSQSSGSSSQSSSSSSPQTQGAHA